MAGRSRADVFLAKLTALGGRAGNGALRTQIGWSEDLYDHVKLELLASSAIVRQAGRGGGVAFARPAEDPVPGLDPSPPNVEAMTSDAPAEPKNASAAPRGARRKEKTAPDIATTLWAAADKLRGNMDAAEYKHVALGLIFLKYISDRFEERRAQALADSEEADLVEERDLYLGDNGELRIRDAERVVAAA